MPPRPRARLRTCQLPHRRARLRRCLCTRVLACPVHSCVCGGGDGVGTGGRRVRGARLLAYRHLARPGHVPARRGRRGDARGAGGRRLCCARRAGGRLRRHGRVHEPGAGHIPGGADAGERGILPVRFLRGDAAHGGCGRLGAGVRRLRVAQGGVASRRAHRAHDVRRDQGVGRPARGRGARRRHAGGRPGIRPRPRDGRPAEGRHPLRERPARRGQRVVARVGGAGCRRLLDRGGVPGAGRLRRELRRVGLGRRGLERHCHQHGACPTAHPDRPAALAHPRARRRRRRVVRGRLAREPPCGRRGLGCRRSRGRRGARRALRSVARAGACSAASSWWWARCS